MNDNVKSVNKVLKLAIKLPDDAIKETEQLAKDQANYTHPLKLATQGKINLKGKNNLFILQKLRELREAILLNENL